MHVFLLSLRKLLRENLAGFLNFSECDYFHSNFLNKFQPSQANAQHWQFKKQEATGDLQRGS